jgi:Na+/phosphate symporter
MSTPAFQKLLTKTHLLIGAVLTFVFFGFMSVVLLPFTFSENALIAQAQACFTAVPIAAVFWFSYHMFMIVLVDQKKRKKQAE